MKSIILGAVLGLALCVIPRGQAMADNELTTQPTSAAPTDQSINITDDSLPTENLVAPGRGGGGGGRGGGGGHPGGGHPGGGYGHGGGPVHGAPGGHGPVGHEPVNHGGYEHGTPGHGYGGSGFRDGYRGGRFGYHGGRFFGYPGWYAGWAWDYAWLPFWVTAGIVWPGWIWLDDAPAGYYQCTAFNQQLQPFSAVGPDENQATYGALNLCSDGADPQAAGCYVPPGYCRLH